MGGVCVAGTAEAGGKPLGSDSFELTKEKELDVFAGVAEFGFHEALGQMIEQGCGAD
ncbi:MAG: hypothetical protein LBT13_09950 [Treponema sp.]|jgi:hypothetical protein|nr:hypothetical protein [Treponema sp.]